MMSTEKMQVSASFTPYHYPQTQGAQRRFLSFWEEKTMPGGHRCKVCWLNLRSCYCSYLVQRRILYRASTKSQRVSKGDEEKQTPSSPHFHSSAFESLLSSEGAAHIEFILYYHYRELGRSANTAHLLESLLDVPVIVFGDSEKEISLAEEMKKEFMEGTRRTVILYPSKDAIGLDEWLLDNNVDESEPSSGDSPSSSVCDGRNRGVLRVVLLDGTYSDASMMANHLKQLLATYGVPCPLVKLNLENGKCQSAYVGKSGSPRILPFPSRS